MIPYGLFQQILFIAVSGVIVVSYIKPNLVEVGKIQDNTEVYRQEIEKVSSVNAKLASLKSSYNSISQTDRLKLLTYMPDEVDTIAVPRDIYAIAAVSGVTLRQVSYDSSDSSSATVETVGNLPDAHKFTVDLEGSYFQIKDMLSLLEENTYPLEINNMDIGKTEGGFLTANLEVVTYDRSQPVEIQAALQ